MGIKEQLQKLSEDELRKKIIIPLLKVTNFEHIKDLCGPNESGKDILYVRRDLLSSTYITGAVLLKNEKDITKSGKSDIRKIADQAREAITNPIPDPLDPHKETNIREIYVITSFDIAMEAMKHIHTTLNNSQLYLKFINGDQLEQQITKIIGSRRYSFTPDSFGEFCKKQIEISGKKKISIPSISVIQVSEGKNIEPKLAKINQIVQSKKYFENKDVILASFKDRELRFYFLGKLSKKFADLREIEFLLEEVVKDERPFDLFKILKESISDKNNGFIINFLQKHYKGLERKPDDLFQRESLKIVKKIIEQYPNIVDDAFTSVKQVLTLRGKEYEEFGSKQKYDIERKLIAELLEKVFSVYKEQNDKNRTKEIVKSIDKHFNLVGDDGEFVMYTPNNIFKILKDYIDIDFGENFKEITRILINQYSQQGRKYKITYNGWELMGGTTSVSGYNYKVFDRHFILYSLKPAIENYHKKNKKKTWDFIVNNCITKTKKVSRNYPDFLNRAVLPIVLERYADSNKKTSDEAFEILKEFILSRKGIPHKSELIYQELRSGFSDDKKWQLIKVSIDKDKIPVNPFVEQITLELAKKEGWEKPKKILRDWIKNPDYYQRGGFFERNVVVNISQSLDVSLNEGVEMFKDFIKGNYFLKKMGHFDTFDVARLLNKIVNKDVKTGLKILKNLSQKSELTVNEQILLCSSLTSKSNAKEEDEKVLMKIYKEFLNLFLNSLGNDIKKIERKITHSQSRGEIVEFADTLAKHKKIPEAMRIVRIFINDSDPCTPRRKDPDDPEGKYDGHKRIKQGEDMNTITTVRGRCAWTLMDCSVLAGRDYTEEVINLVEKLTKDKNYYIQLMSCYSLSQLARNRLTVIPDNREELFLNKNKEKGLKMAKRIEKISFNLLEKFSQLEDSKPRDVSMKALLRVFDHIRALNQKEALKLMEKIAECGEKVIAEASSLFIYYAEIRKQRDNFKNWKWKMPGLYDDLENFDEKVFQKLLKDVLKKENPEINSQFAWQFWKLTKESIPDKADIKKTIEYSKAFEISIKYLNILANNYNHQTFENTYYFIQENIDKRFEDCYKLWRKCLEEEKSIIIKEFIKKGKTYEAYWWPFYYNGEILMVIKQKGGDKKFLSSLEFLSGYPKELIIGEIDEAVKTLRDLPIKYDQQVEKIFNKLIVRNPNFYDEKKVWERSKAKS